MQEPVEDGKVSCFNHRFGNRPVGRRREYSGGPASEAPDNSGRGVVVVLVGAGVVTVQVIGLQPPGKMLEGKLVVGAAAEVKGERVVNEVIGVGVPDSAHGVDEGAPFSEGHGQARAADKIVLRHLVGAAAVVTAGVGHQTEVRKAGKGKRLERSLPPAITL